MSVAPPRVGIQGTVPLPAAEGGDFYSHPDAKVLSLWTRRHEPGGTWTARISIQILMIPPRNLMGFSDIPLQQLTCQAVGSLLVALGSSGLLAEGWKVGLSHEIRLMFLCVTYVFTLLQFTFFVHLSFSNSGHSPLGCHVAIWHWQDIFSEHDKNIYRLVYETDQQSITSSRVKIKLQFFQGFHAGTVPLTASYTGIDQLLMYC